MALNVVCREGWSITSVFWIPVRFSSKVYDAVCWVFKGRGSRAMIALSFETDCVMLGVTEKRIPELLDRVTRPYASSIPFPLREESLNIPKTFWSDILRSGQPDQFILNRQKIPPPRSQEQQNALIQKIYEGVEGDLRKVERLLGIWNYRLKAYLMDQVTQHYQTEYEVTPVFPREGIHRCSISLDIETRSLSCEIVGDVQNATKEISVDDMPEILSFKSNYYAFLKLVFSGGVLEQTVWVRRCL